MTKILSALIAVVAGVGGTIVLFWIMNKAVEALPEKVEHRLKPYVFIGPALIFVALFLIYPAIRTIILSFFDNDGEAFVGLDNYTGVFGDRATLSSLLNNVLWLAIVPIVSVALGLLIAVMADRLTPRWEKATKSLIFLPMAISAVGSSTIFLFIYAWRPEGRPQIGLLNAIWSGVLGNQPENWVQVSDWRLNTLLLIVIMIWGQAGFAMVLLSSAVKGVPTDTLEAARIDGATEVQIFWRVIIPQIASTIAVVLTTIGIGVLKVFDIVYVMTNGQFETNVIANTFIQELFSARRPGRAAAVVVILMLLTVPIMIYNIRQFRAQEAR